MASSLEFLKHILTSSKPETNPTELSLYNAIKNFSPSESSQFDNGLLISIYRRLLLFPYWRNKQAEIDQHLKRWILSFSKKQNLNLNPIYFTDVQYVKVQNTKSVSLFLTKYFQAIYPLAKIKIMEIAKEQTMVLCLKANSELSVHLCNNEFLIFEGKFEPLVNFQELHYDADLKLSLSKRHSISLKPFRLVRFEMSPKGWEVKETTGYSFKKQADKYFEQIEQYSDLYYQIKSIESKFIHKSSDPLYLAISGEIELAIENLAESGEYAREEASKTYQKARNIFDHIFPDDRLLHLLLKELALLIASNGKKDFTDSSQENEEEWQKIKTQQVSDLINT